MKRTPLYEEHILLGGKIIDFNGWEMPVQYESIIEEHLSVRRNVGMFDISHMGEIEISGEGAKDTILNLTPVQEKKLTSGKAAYSFLLNERGGIIDDLIVYTFDENRFLLVVNAGNIEKDLNWIRERASPKTNVKDLSKDIAAISVQGPNSGKIFKNLFNFDLSSLKYYSFEREIELRDLKIQLVSRTGYTGELGFEIYAQPETIIKLWKTLLEMGVKACGLGARDSLRLEAGMPLYGHELDEETTPIEANLEKFVDTERNFIGKEALLERAPIKRLIGLKMVDKSVPRQGQRIFSNGKEVGYVTSGGFSPSLGEYIAMGYVKHEFKEEEISIEIRDKLRKAILTALPFYKRG